MHARELRIIENSKDLIEQAVPEWKCRDQFSRCFYDLDRVGRDKGAYSLKDLSDSLDSETARNERQFEVFGIKFPTEELSRWGIVSLIAILVYFCLHLRELSPKMTPTDAGLDVAWIGLYSSWFAYSLLWVSVLVVPGIAVILLGLEGARFQGPLSVAVRTNGWNLCLRICLPSIACYVVRLLLSGGQEIGFACVSPEAPPKCRHQYVSGLGALSDG